jgi:hypothetical protein
MAHLMQRDLEQGDVVPNHDFRGLYRPFWRIG